MIIIEHKGDLSLTTKFLEKAPRIVDRFIFDRYGSMGVEALKSVTPVDSGTTADSWFYRVDKEGGVIKLVFSNSHVNKGVNIAIILQYGHGTGTGGWVEGRDYINPAIQPVFDQIAEDLWREVTER